MKRGFLVILALVMALVLIMGSASTVSAGKAPALIGASVTISKVNVSPQTISYNFEWSGLASVTSTYKIEFFKSDAFMDNICALGEVTDPSFAPTDIYSDKARFKNISSFTISSGDYVFAILTLNGTSVFYSNQYAVP